MVSALLPVYACLIDMHPGTAAWLCPIAAGAIAMLMLNSMSDLGMASVYRAMGIRMRSLWMSNWVFTSMPSLLISGISITVCGAVFDRGFDLSMVSGFLMSVPAVLAISAMHNIYLRGYSKAERIIGFIFWLVGLGAALVLLMFPSVEIGVAAMASTTLVFVVSFVAALLHFRSEKCEDVIRGGEQFAKMYDDI